MMIISSSAVSSVSVKCFFALNIVLAFAALSLHRILLSRAFKNHDNT
jgi:hypothetical protein